MTELPFQTATGGGATDPDSGLTPEEDKELRQLTWFAKVGQLSEASMTRVAELLAKDRRSEVRDPRPNPSAAESVPPPTLPPIEVPPAPTVICPNCGSIVY